MIEYEFNEHKNRYEFLFLTPDKKKYTLNYITPDTSEADKIKYLVKWFNECMRLMSEQETSPQK